MDKFGSLKHCKVGIDDQRQRHKCKDYSYRYTIEKIGCKIKKGQENGIRDVFERIWIHIYTSTPQVVIYIKKQELRHGH